MLFNLFWGDFTILIVIPGILLALWAQLRVKMTFSSFSRVPAKNGMTGADAARRILDENGLYDVRIEPIQGQLTDHYDPRDRVCGCQNPALLLPVWPLWGWPRMRPGTPFSTPGDMCRLLSAWRWSR